MLHTQWGVLLCDLVSSPRVKLLYDIYHMQIMEGDIVRTIRDYHGYFSHYHTAGNPGRRDMDHAQELNYLPIMEAIAASGYTGFVGHEIRPQGKRPRRRPCRRVQPLQVLARRTERVTVASDRGDHAGTTDLLQLSPQSRHKNVEKCCWSPSRTPKRQRRVGRS